MSSQSYLTMRICIRQGIFKKILKSGEKMTRRKVYVTVNAEHKPDGSCLPKTIRMADEEEFEIDKVLQVRKAASDVGGRGIRYTVRIGRSETHLFDEQNGRWFVEAKFG